MKKIILIMVAAIILGLIAGCQQETFKGDCIEDDVTFTLDYTYFNETREHRLYIDEGGQMNVDIEAEKGHIDIYIYDEGGNVIYQGNDAATASFVLEITESGDYKIAVTGKKASGKVSFVVGD